MSPYIPMIRVPDLDFVGVGSAAAVTYLNGDRSSDLTPRLGQRLWQSNRATYESRHK